MGDHDENEEGGGGKKCYWEQIAHAPDYSWIKVKCMETIYSDPSKVKCTCGSADETWSFD